jgi:hypothetical protein
VETKIWQCLLCKNINIIIYKTINFACGSVCVGNYVSDSNGGIQTHGVWEQGAEGNIWTKEG